MEWYDPWVEDQARQAAREEDRAYKSLFRLVNNLLRARARSLAVEQNMPERYARHFVRYGEIEVNELPRKETKLLLAWCRRNGLLGLLTQQLIRVTALPVWFDYYSSLGDDLKEFTGPGGILRRAHAADADNNPALAAVQRALTYGPNGWGITQKHRSGAHPGLGPEGDCCGPL